MLLRDVDLRIGSRNDSAHRKTSLDNENETFHMLAKIDPPASLYNSTPHCLSRVYGSTMVAQK